MAKVVRKPDTIAKVIGSLLPEDESALLETPRFDGYFENLDEMVKDGSKGAYWDARVFMREWGFDCEDIEVPVFLLYGTGDQNAPIQMGEYYRDAIPNTDATFYEGDGTMIIAADVAAGAEGTPVMAIEIRVGVEGTESYGVGLTRYLHREGIEVVEVDHPNRQTRRKFGKSDPIDAEAAARAALSGTATVTPKRRDGTVEQMRVLMIARRSARIQRNQTLNQLRQIVFTGPDEIRVRFKDRHKTGLVSEAARMRPRKGSDPIVFTTNIVIRGLARRIQDLNDETATIDDALAGLIDATAPSLLEQHGVGVVTAATLLVTAGDNPDRLHSERSWAHLCGASPVPTGSGKTSGRVRLNHGGDRQANAALYQIVLTRMSSDPETRNYVRRRRVEGLSTREIMRCLKRYVARQTLKHLPRAA